MPADIFGKFTTGEIRSIVNSHDYEKMAAVPVGDLRVFFENEEQRKVFTMSGIKNLYKGICLQAVEDYKTAHKMTLFRFNKFSQPKPSSIEKTLENFFGSEFFLSVTGMRSKEHVIKTIEQTMIEERKRQLQRSMA